jgi:hypothetical protein
VFSHRRRGTRRPICTRAYQDQCAYDRVYLQQIEAYDISTVLTSSRLETNNLLEHPTGPEYQLVLGEGVYTLKDDLLIATPPPHPSDAPQPNTNPLATTIGPPTTGTKLSIAVLAPRKPPSQNLFRINTQQSGRSQFASSIQEEAYNTKREVGFDVNGSEYQASSFGDGNPALLPIVTAKGKKDQRTFRRD